MASSRKISWTHFPKDRAPDPTVVKIIEAFENSASSIDSEKFGKSGTNREKTEFDSNYVLGIVEDDLKKIDGFWSRGSMRKVRRKS